MNTSECQKCGARFLDGVWVMWNDKLGENCTLYKRVCTLPQVIAKPTPCANPSLEECAGNPAKGLPWDMEFPKPSTDETLGGLL